VKVQAAGGGGVVTANAAAMAAISADVSVDRVPIPPVLLLMAVWMAVADLFSLLLEASGP
jgi:hypothetical protein